MDVLSDVLRVIRLSGRVQYYHTLSAPWCIESPTPSQLVSLLAAGNCQIVSFHIVAEGRGWIGFRDQGEPQPFFKGDIVVIPSSAPHILSDQPNRPIQEAIELFPEPPWPDLLVLKYGGEGAVTQLVCGFLLCDELLIHPFLNTLPKLMRVATSDETQSPLLVTGVRYIIEETRQKQLGSDSVLARLTEVMFLEILRRYMQAMPVEEIGWLPALNDPIVGPVLELMHAHPEYNWQVAELAKQVGASRSLLASRFSHFLGQPPKQYLTQWRLQLALNLLRSTDDSVARIASQVGYDSEYAFNRAFKRFVGMPPATWRKSQHRSVSSEVISKKEITR